MRNVVMAGKLNQGKGTEHYYIGGYLKKCCDLQFVINPLSRVTTVKSLLI